MHAYLVAHVFSEYGELNGAFKKADESMDIPNQKRWKRQNHVSSELCSMTYLPIQSQSSDY